jgi:hypothetical protein
MTLFQPNAILEDQGGDRKSLIRFRAYWILSVLSVTLFLLMTYVAAMLQYPRGHFPPVLGLLIYCPPFMLSGASLLIGVWNFRATDAPIANWPLGPVLGIFVGLEFGLCVIALGQVVGRILLQS